MTARELLDETFDTRLAFGTDSHEEMRGVMKQLGMKAVGDNPGYVDKAAKIGDKSYRLKIAHDPITGLPNAYSVIFMLEGGGKDSFGLTGTGNQFQVLGGMANEVRSWAIRTRPAYITFSAEGNTRIRIYAKVVDMILKSLGGAYVLDQRKTWGPSELFIVRAKKAPSTVPDPEEPDPDDDIPM